MRMGYSPLCATAENLAFADALNKYLARVSTTKRPSSQAVFLFKATLNLSKEKDVFSFFPSGWLERYCFLQLTRNR